MWHTFWLINVTLNFAVVVSLNFLLLFRVVAAVVVVVGCAAVTVAFIINFMQKVFHASIICRRAYIKPTNSLALNHFGQFWHTSLMHLSEHPLLCLLWLLAALLTTTLPSLQYNYLMQFDYLPKSDLETGALRTEEQLIDALSKLQVGSCQTACSSCCHCCHCCMPHVLCTISQTNIFVSVPQAFGNIPVTGKIDAATAKLIQLPRCGVGDNEHAYNFSPDNLDHGPRKRRYVLQGAKWDKTDLTWR